MILEKINEPEDLNNLSTVELFLLAEEIRSKIIQVLSLNGGHLSSNLGIVDLTIAIHRVFSSPTDKIIFDTGHQTYAHKILTGRRNLFDQIRKLGGISGFPSPEESRHDPFYTGHAGTALSLALGVAKQLNAMDKKEHVIAILGDATLTCGLTFEALNNISRNLERLIVILNDNKMAISRTVGNIKNLLSRLLNNPTSNKLYIKIQKIILKIPFCGSFLARQGKKIVESVKNLVSTAPFFEQFGLSYIGPIDGHNIKKMVEIFSAIKNSKKPVLVHVLTKKGKGMTKAIQDPIAYHGVRPFDANSGNFLPILSLLPNFYKIFAKYIIEMAEKDPSLYLISPATLVGTGLIEFRERFPNRCIDVGIAEEHAVTFASGLAFKENFKVIVSIYSTFLQRAFDNIFHDICLQKSSVIFAIDRAGIAGSDGVTHHGIYDVGFLYSMPNAIIAQPRNGTVLKELLNKAFSWKSPTFIRYPNRAVLENDNPKIERSLGKAEILEQGEELLLIGVGHMYQTALEVKKLLKVNATVVDPVFIKPLDESLFTELLKTHYLVATIEEHALTSGFGMIFNSFVLKRGFTKIRVMNFGIDDKFVGHGNISELLKLNELDPISIANKIKNKYASSTISK